MKIATFLLIASLLFAAGCNRGLSTQLDVDSPNSSQDHLKIASYYSRQAVLSRQKAAEQANRALIYEQVFGHDSDWVAGAQMLTQFYEDAAREQDRQASLHLELAGRQPSSR